jgi:hypothetical protein
VSVETDDRDVDPTVDGSRVGQPAQTALVADATTELNPRPRRHGRLLPWVG